MKIGETEAKVEEHRVGIPAEWLDVWPEVLGLGKGLFCD